MTLEKNTKNLRFYTQDQSIGRLEWDQKDSSQNLLSLSFMEDLSSLLKDIKQLKLKALIVTSKKEKSFCAGADIKEIQKIKTKEEMRKILDQAHDLFLQFENLDCVKIAVIQGACLGGGLEFALCCDYRLVAEDPSVQIGLPEIRLGLIPGFGGCLRLPRLIGLKKSLEMILTGKSLNPRQALKIGLADERIPDPVLEKRALEKAQNITQQSAALPIKNHYRDKKAFAFFLEKTTKRIFCFLAAKRVLKKSKGFYPAPLKALKLIQSVYGSPVSNKSIEKEKEVFCDLFSSSESQNLIRLWTLINKAKKIRPESQEQDRHIKPGPAHHPLNRSESQEQDRHIKPGPAHHPLNRSESQEQDRHIKPESAHHPLNRSENERHIKRVGILGAGVMGRAIAWLFADRGFQVRLIDIQDQKLCESLSWTKNLWEKQKINPYVLKQKRDRLSFSSNLWGLSTMDLIIEALPEDQSLKQKLIAKVSKDLKSSCLLASNSSSLSILKLAESALKPENFFGFHFFNPVEKSLLIELSLTENQKETLLSPLQKLSKRIGKIPIFVKDSPGFIVNRLLAVYLLEAFFLYEEGCEIKKIDSLYERFGLPLGPFRLMDHVGLDIGSSVIFHLQKAQALAEAPPFVAHIPKQLGLGKKEGKGFYIYERKKRSVNPEVYQIKRKRDTSDLGDEEILQRGIYLMINEGKKLVKEKLVSSEEDIDLALILGIGFPAFLGGPMSYARTIGLPEIKQRLKELEERYGKRFQACF